jgi:hypothetical protein
MKKYLLPLLIFSLFLSCRQNDRISSPEQTEIIEVSQNDMMVISPQPGDDWKPGTTQIIRWKTATGIGSVQIQLYRKDELKMTISNSYANTGSYTWIVPTNLASSVHYKIKLVAIERPTVSYTTDFFYIKSDKPILPD